jgi:hypothetical protein
VDVAVLRVGRRAKRFRIRQIADDRPRAARRDVGGLLVVAHERRHLVTAANERVENGAADVAGGAGEEDAHEFGSLLRRGPPCVWSTRDVWSIDHATVVKSFR